MADVDQATWGLVPKEVLERIVVVSPHFDDAVLGAADLLGTYPGSDGHHRSWPVGRRSTRRRRRTGTRAADSWRATTWSRRGARKTWRLWRPRRKPVWLDVADHQYLAKKDRQTAEEVAPSLKKAIVRPRTDGCVPTDGDRQPRSRPHPRCRVDRAVELLEARRKEAGSSGSATRTTATSTFPGLWLGGSSSCSSPGSGRLRRSSRSMPDMAPEATRDRVLCESGASARTGPRTLGAVGWERPGAVLAPRPTATRVGRD